MNKGKRKRLEKAAARGKPLSFTDIRHAVAVTHEPPLPTESEIRQVFEEMRQQREATRINNLPMGAPENRHKIDFTFRPLEKLIADIVTDGHDTLPDGTPVMQDPVEGHWFPILPAFTSMCDTFAKLAKRFGWQDQTAGLRQLANKLNVAMPLFQSDIDMARASIAWMREHIARVTPKQFSEEAIEVQIRDEQAARKAA